MDKTFKEAHTVHESSLESSLNTSQMPSFNPAGPVASSSTYPLPPASLTPEAGPTEMDTSHPASSADASAHACASSPSDEIVPCSASRTADDPQNGITDEQKREAATHVTIWNRMECRKIAGNAAPLRRNLARYLERHPDCEEYLGQDKRPGYTNPGSDPATGNRLQTDHVPIWHCWEQRKVTGNAAPLRKNLATYLKKHPECEVYAGQDKRGPRSASRRASWPVAATTDASVTNATQVQVFTSSVASGEQSERFVNSSNQHETCAEPIEYLPTHSDPAAPVVKNGHIYTTTLVSERPELTYSEMASSWSNNPEWAGISNAAHSSDLGLSLQHTPPHSYSDTSLLAEHGISPMEVEIASLEIPPMEVPDIGMDRDASASSEDNQTGPDISSLLDLNDHSLDIALNHGSSQMEFMESPCMFDKLISEIDQVGDRAGEESSVGGPSTDIGGAPRKSSFDDRNIGTDVDAYNKYISETGEQLMNNKNYAGDYGEEFVKDIGGCSEGKMNDEKDAADEGGSYLSDTGGASETWGGAGAGNQ